LSCEVPCLLCSLVMLSAAKHPGVHRARPFAPLRVTRTCHRDSPSCITNSTQHHVFLREFLLFHLFFPMKLCLFLYACSCSKERSVQFNTVNPDYPGSITKIRHIHALFHTRPLMHFNLLIRTSQQPPKADKSAPSDVRNIL